MRTVATATIASLMVTVVAISPATAEIPWQQNLRSAHAKAESEGKLMLLHFYSDNCVYCDRLEAGAFQAPQVGEAVAQNFVAMKIHANSAPQLVEMFKVTKFPTDVIVKPDGTKLVHRVSPQNPDKYVAMLAGTLQHLPLAGQAIAAAPAPSQPAPSQPAASQPAPTVTDEPVAGLTMPKSTPAQTASTVRRASTAGQATSQLAGYHNQNQSIEMPTEPVVQPEPAASEPAASEPVTVSPSSEPELAMEGFCAVTVINEDRWAEGKPEFSVIHLGKLYLFADENAMSTFLADPVPYTPVLNEIDVVRFFEERTIVPGKREWGVKDPNYQRMFFFADEAAMNHFIEEHHRYTDAAIEVMQKAVKDANPGS